MDFGDIAKQVISLGAPILGTALGGPLGGAAGKILADSLGANEPTPTAISDALGKADPATVQAQLGDAEAKWQETLKAEAETAGIVAAQVNQTARAEIVSNDPFTSRARPATLYAFALVGSLIGLGLALAIIAAVWTGSAEMLTAVAGAVTAGATLLGVMAFPATGFVASRGREKQAAITGQSTPGMLDQLIGAIARK